MGEVFPKHLLEAVLEAGIRNHAYLVMFLFDKMKKVAKEEGRDIEEVFEEEVERIREELPEPMSAAVLREVGKCMIEEWKQWKNLIGEREADELLNKIAENCVMKLKREVFGL